MKVDTEAEIASCFSLCLCFQTLMFETVLLIHISNIDQMFWNIEMWNNFNCSFLPLIRLSLSLKKINKIWTIIWLLRYEEIKIRAMLSDIIPLNPGFWLVEKRLTYIIPLNPLHYVSTSLLSDVYTLCHTILRSLILL